MIGVLLMSHGNMAEGMLHTSKLFFGQDVEQIEALCLQADDNPEEFDARINEAVARIDDGSGVVALCDLLGGTPCNRSMYVIAQNPNVKVLTGMNLTILLELLGQRLSVENVNELDITALSQVGKDGVVYLNEMLNPSV